MKKKNFGVYHTFPSKMMSFLFKKGIIVSPELANTTDYFKIEVKYKDGSVGKGKQLYHKDDPKKLNEALFRAIEYTYEKEHKRS